MSDLNEISITAIAPWFGSNRMLAQRVGAVMGPQQWIGVPFCGGLSELLHLKARSYLVCDLHRHIINLARVASDEELGPRLARRLRRVSFHEVELSEAQGRASKIMPPDPDDLSTHEGRERSLASAIDYFVSVWMGRSSKAGTKSELKGSLSIRWEGAGGDSATRYQNAISSLKDWRKVLRRCQFVCQDALTEFLPKCLDRERCGLYVDPPFDRTGKSYRHEFTRDHHREMAQMLLRFTKTRVVCRFYDCIFVRDLYPATEWDWIELVGRRQTNDLAPEVLLVRRTGGA